MRTLQLTMPALCAVALLLLTGIAHAQPGSMEHMHRGMGGCPMHGGMGIGMMVLGALFLVALIAVLIALTFFLIRHSRPRGPISS